MARRAAYDRDKALTQALELFWRKGFHATSLKDVEAALDMRPGSIYAAFGSKEMLFAEALDAYAAASRAAFQAAMASAERPLDGVIAHVRALAGAEPLRACMLVKTVLETPAEDPAARAAAEALLSRAEAGFRAAFAAAQAAGDVDPSLDPTRLARKLQASIVGLRALAHRAASREAVEALADDIVGELESLRLTAEPRA